MLWKLKKWIAYHKKGFLRYVLYADGEIKVFYFGIPVASSFQRRPKRFGTTFFVGLEISPIHKENWWDFKERLLEDAKRELKKILHKNPRLYIEYADYLKTEDDKLEPLKPHMANIRGRSR